MKKITYLIISIILLLNFLVSPFYYLNIKEKTSMLYHKIEFKKGKVKVDSLVMSSSNDNTGGMEGSSSPPTYIYYLFYDGGKTIALDDASNALFYSKVETQRTKSALKYMEINNDSLLIWYHPIINGQYALEEETEINTEGYLIQIIINSILLAVALYSIIWQIKEWRKPKKND